MFDFHENWNIEYRGVNCFLWKCMNCLYPDPGEYIKACSLTESLTTFVFRGVYESADVWGIENFKMVFRKICMARINRNTNVVKIGQAQNIRFAGIFCVWHVIYLVPYFSHRKIEQPKIWCHFPKWYLMW